MRAWCDRWNSEPGRDGKITGLTLEDLRKRVERMPFNGLLGIRVTKLHSDGVSIACDVRDQLRNSAGMLHGGVIATMADAAV